MAASSQNRIILSRRQLVKFIELYRMQPCIWDVKHNDYRVKSKKVKAVRQIVEQFKQFCPEVTSEFVLRKIESIRACYRKERHKVRNNFLKKNGESKKRLWYYGLLSFIDSNNYNSYAFEQPGENNNIRVATAYISITGDTNASDDFKQEKSEEEDNNDVEEIDDVGNHDTESYVTYDNICRSNQIEVADTSSASAKRYQGYEEEKGKRHCTEIEDEYDAIGINVAAKLRNLPPNMRIVAEKLINDVLYQAQTNGLNSSSVITTPDPFK